MSPRNSENRDDAELGPSSLDFNSNESNNPMRTTKMQNNKKKLMQMLQTQERQGEDDDGPFT